MPEVTMIAISGEQSRILLSIVGYENPTSIDTDDANWVTSEVEIAVGPFTGKYRAAMTTYDFDNFCLEVEALLNFSKPKAEFTTHEGWLNLHIEMTKQGGVIVSGSAAVHGLAEATLAFTFPSDQSQLQQTLISLRWAIKQFPIKP